MREKIAVINYSGNVGKSVIVRHVLSPRMPDAEVISVETINSGLDKDEADTLNAKQCRAIFTKVSMANQIIVDVGSSNAEQFIEQLKAIRGAQALFDLFVVPTVPFRKQMSDTIDTLIMLSALGVEPGNIKVVLNMSEPDTVREEFAALFTLFEESPLFVLDEKLMIPLCEVYDSAKGSNRTVYDLARDDPDAWKAKIKSASDTSEKERYARMMIDIMMAKPQDEFQQVVCNELFK